MREVGKIKVVPYRNKQLKTYFYGRVVVTLEGLEAYFTVLINLSGSKQCDVIGEIGVYGAQAAEHCIEKMPKI
jgi:hypothetical protein